MNKDKKILYREVKTLYYKRILYSNKKADLSKSASKYFYFKIN